MIAVESPTYHAHIYFTPDRHEVAAALQARALQALEGRADVLPLVAEPRGPHVVPMFEIDFDHAHRDTVITWLGEHHGALSVLLHPVTEDEWADHTEHLVWLGDRQPLDLSKL
jgi:DOPA 4,5-dioxygenase